MKKSFISKGLVAIAASSLLLFGGHAAHATPPPVAPPELAELVELYTLHGVDPETTSELVAEILAGNLPDSVTGGIPDSVSTQETPEGTVSVETFGDGSILVSTIEAADESNPTGIIQPRAISGCRDFSSGGYVSKQGCTISQATGLFTMSFKADYSFWGSGASIGNAHSPAVQAWYGTATLPTLNRTSATGSGTAPAVVTSYSRYTNHAGTSSEDLYLSLRVYTKSATTTSY